MTTNPEDPVQGQEPACECLVCALHQLVDGYIDNADALGEPGHEQIQAIIEGVASVFGSLLNGQNQRNTRIFTDELVRQIKLAKVKWEAVEVNDSQGTTH